MHATTTMYGPAVHRGKDVIHKPCVISMPQQCCKSFANGSNFVALHFGDHETKEMLRVTADSDV